MLRGDTITRDILADLIRSAVDETVIQQKARGAQEPAVTSKIAGQLERQLNGMGVLGRRITVVAQDFTDRGPGSQEKRAGADLFIAIRVEDSETTISKGLLIQAKWWGGFKSKAEQKKLVQQCSDMLERTTTAGAFVWLYGSDGVDVVPACEVTAQPYLNPEVLKQRNVAQQFRDVLDCFQGDPDNAPEVIFDDPTALGGYMADIAARTGLAITVGSRFDELAARTGD